MSIGEDHPQTFFWLKSYNVPTNILLLTVHIPLPSALKLRYGATKMYII